MASVERSTGALNPLRPRLKSAGQRSLSDAEHRLQLAMRALNSISPLATLDRGYAIVMDADSGGAQHDASTVTTGAKILARLHSGELTATVTNVTSDDD